VKFTLLTLFPEYFTSPLGTSLLGRAATQGVLSFSFVNFRDHGEGRYKAVDDRPYGGGPGMVMAAPVLEAALAAALKLHGATLEDLESDVAKSNGVPLGPQEGKRYGLPFVVYLSPQGVTLTAARGRQWATEWEERPVILICGHYEGLDERFIETFVHLEVSIGDYVLTGGETAAVALIETLARFVPGVVGEAASVTADTFETADPALEPGGLKYPMYTRPPEYRGRAVPEVLTSGNHGAIEKWRREQSRARTLAKRPDLFKNATPIVGKKK
jgi:tRNA (guanine37-N1)-methyltransferase